MHRRNLGWLANLLALALLLFLALTPFLFKGQAVPPWQRAAQKAAPIVMARTSQLPEPLLAVWATPTSPNSAPASLPTLDSVEAASVVAGEDLRLRNLIHHLGRLIYPIVVPTAAQLDSATGALRPVTPTLVLPGPSSYTIGDLQTSGAVLPLNQGGFLLVDNVLVGPGATLTLGGPNLPLLLMGSSAQGFTSIVTWNGTLTLAGESPSSPLTITGWDSTNHKAAVDDGHGRPYIRDVGGKMDVRNVRASSLGFWSGRTGGVAWTGISGHPATGSAIASTFVGNTYGAFVSRADGVKFTDDLFEGNELDGLRLHRNATNSIVSSSASARNGGNGFVVSRGATGDTLHGDVAINNHQNGFLINGAPLVAGASPSGDRAVASIGTVLEDSEAKGNARTGILIEGGNGTIVRRNIVAATVTAIAVRSGATNTMVLANEVRSGGRVALSIGPAVTGTTVASNTFNDARIGVLIRNSLGVRIIDNRFTGISIFGISVRGQSFGVVGNNNVIAGRGFQPIDTRGGATNPLITTTDTSGWQHRTSLSLVGQLRYHPILTTWLGIMSLVLLSSILVRRRRRPTMPYSYTVPWRPTTQIVGDGRLLGQPAVSPAGTLVVAANGREPARRRRAAGESNGHVDAAEAQPAQPAITSAGEAAG